MKNTVRILTMGLGIAVSLQSVGASRFSAADQPLGSIGPIVLSKTDVSGGGVKAYRPWFENGSWQGDLVEYSVSSAGALSTSVSLVQTSPSNTGSPPANWSALVAFKTAETANSMYWDTGREIITARSDVQKAFRWSVDSLGATVMATLDPDAVSNSDSNSGILDWVRGDRSNEFPATVALRARVSILGDIIHSNPRYVGPPQSNLTGNGYGTWAQGKASREARVYVGSNNGMLHAFDASDGTEVYAYVPSMIIPNLNKLPGRPYAHTYFVDGKLTTGDAYFSGAWHTILVGTLGAGGAGIFALDITNPDLSDETATTGTDIKVLWEKSNASDADLGDSFSRPQIAKLNDGKWYVIVGNGYNSANGVATLYLISLDDKSIRKITTSSGNSGDPNGLSSPSLLDVNSDGTADYVYAGDIDGNLWKFNLTSTSPDSWAEAYGRPLHAGTSSQPITIAPEITSNQGGGYLLFFATGRLFIKFDMSDNSIQGMYGIFDDGTTPPLAADEKLLAQTFDAQAYTADTISEQVAIFKPDAGSVDYTTYNGWKVLYPAGSRVLEGIQVRGTRSKVTVTDPNSRDNWIAESSVFDGGPHDSPIYDLNTDDVLNNADLIIDTGANYVPMAWQRPSGIMSKVTIARVADGIDVLLLNYLEPPVSTPCTGSCEGGFQGGHIDVDTWHKSEPFGGKSSMHDHEYDKQTGRVYVDAFDLNVPLPAGAVAPRKEVGGQIEINDPSSGIPSSEKFVVLLANADFSPGSTLKIGDRSWNVAQYQKEIHIALKNWDASVPANEPLDSDGKSLIFTWGEIEAVEGNISHNFDDIAIISGGLHPTQTGCVKDSAYGKKDGAVPQTFDPSTLVGRWRNGALTTVLIKASHFTASSAITQVHIQQPLDLVPVVQLDDGRQITMSVDFNDNGTIEASNDELIGGLIAKTGTEEIWESTLFWHFGKLYVLVTGNKAPCYGEANWAAAVVIEQSNNAFATALEYLNVEDLEAEIVASQSCKDTNEQDGGCRDRYKLLEKLVKLRDTYEGTGNGGSSDGVSAGDGEVPVVMGGGAGDQGLTAGPQFDSGRLTWTDVVPD